MESSTLYHITNSSVSPELLVRDEADVLFFKRKLDQYVTPVATIHCFTISPSAFDIVAETKDIHTVSTHRILSGTFIRFSSLFIIRQFSNVMNSYAHHYNAKYRRSGALFKKNFKYGEISEDQYSEILSVFS